MSDISQYKGKKCHDVCDRSQGSLDVESCVTDTDKECTLGEDEKGVQRINVEHAKRHTVDIGVSLESKNQAIEFDDCGALKPTCKREYTMGPSSISSPSSLPFEIDIQQASQTAISKETIDVSVEYEYANSARGLQSGPSAHPRVDLE